MPDESLCPLEQVLIRVDLERPHFTTDHLRRVPGPTWETVLSSGLVVETEAAGAVGCDGCFDGHDADVHWAPATGDAPPRPYVLCPEAGVTWIEPERLRQWSVAVPRFVERLAVALGCSGRVEELVPARLWCLGRVAARGGVREVFFGRGLVERDGPALLVGCARFRAAIAPAVLVAGAVPRWDEGSAPRPTFVAIPQFVTLQGGALAADRAYLLAALGGAPHEEGDAPAAIAPDACVFRRQGKTWFLSFDGVGTSVDDSLGMRYLAELLRSPGTEIHSARLRDVVAGEAPRALGDAGETLDREALRQIKERLDEIREEADEASEFQDVARVERLEEEAELLRAEVARATGLAGRSRRASDDRERARQAVTQGLRRALAAIQREHAGLGRHLARSLRTGASLLYAPNPPRIWTT